MKGGGKPTFDPQVFLAKVGTGKTRVELPKAAIVFSQGGPADAVFYIQKGKIELKVLSQQGKEAILAVLSVGDFFGEDASPFTAPHGDGCRSYGMLGHSPRKIGDDCSAARRAHFFRAFYLPSADPNIRIEEDLVDQLFNSSEKRLARLLLLLAIFGKEGKPEAIIPKVSQEHLAEMIGTTRSRVSFFMNKFRKLGFIEYNGGLSVHSSLINVVLYD